MKKQYEQPAMQVTEMEEHSILETSPSSVIPPGEKNQPAGARSLDDDWDD
ncbi:MAG: hypothetical protein IKP41_06590 [Bacteroidaceae bacterium]|nr:hypothetical protein [Bacteroidaceae bacterium]